jgi:hypothetical protein
MKLKVHRPQESLQAVVHGVEVWGVGFGRAEHEGYFSVGWQRIQHIDIHKESTQFLLQWGGTDFTDVCVGFGFPVIETKAVRLRNTGDKDSDCGARSEETTGSPNLR